MTVFEKVTVTPNRIESLYRYFMQNEKKGVTRDAYVAATSPSILQRRENAGSSMAGSVFDEAVTMAILEETQPNKTYQLTPQLLNKSISLHGYLEQSLLVPQWANQRGQERFPQASAWFLIRDCRQPVSFSATPRELPERVFGENSRGETNNQRLQAFYYWARHMGFAWWLGGNKTGTVIMADPTEILRRHLSRLLILKRRVLLRDLMGELAQQLPIFEGGEVRDELEDQENIARKSLELSGTTSLALLRLEQDGVIALESLSDAPTMSFLISPRSRVVTHVTLQQERNADDL